MSSTTHGDDYGGTLNGRLPKLHRLLRYGSVSSRCALGATQKVGKPSARTAIILLSIQHAFLFPIDLHVIIFSLRDPCIWR